MWYYHLLAPPEEGQLYDPTFSRTVWRLDGGAKGHLLPPERFLHRLGVRRDHVKLLKLLLRPVDQRLRYVARLRLDDLAEQRAVLGPRNLRLKFKSRVLLANLVSITPIENVRATLSNSCVHVSSHVNLVCGEVGGRRQTARRRASVPSWRVSSVSVALRQLSARAASWPPPRVTWGSVASSCQKTELPKLLANMA